VADSRSYALLDVDRQLKIPLFPISSLDDSQSGTVGGKAEDISEHATTTRVQRSTSTAGLNPPQFEDRAHGRSTSLGTVMTGNNRQPSRDRLGRETPDPLFRESSPIPALTPNRPAQRESNPDKPLPAPPSTSESGSNRVSMVVPTGSLKPHIISPSPQEFLLVTGTGTTDPGVGIFVNLEGDVTRSTLEFDRYPEALVTDGRGVGIELSQNNAEEEEEGYVLAVIGKDVADETYYGLEIQRWDIDHGESNSEKFWLQLPDGVSDSGRPRVGIRTVTEAGNITFDEVVHKLCVTRFRPFPRVSSRSSTVSTQSADPRTAASLERVSKEKELFESQDLHGEAPLPRGWEDERSNEELQFAKRLGRAQSRIALWSGNRIWWAARNPLALRLDATLDLYELESGSREPESHVAAITQVINSIRGREAKTEIEFMSLGYIRQRAGMLLLIDLIRGDIAPTDSEYRVAEEALLEGGLDPRVVIALSPELRGEIIEGRTGIWISAGIRDVAEDFISQKTANAEDVWDTQNHSLQFYRRFLTAWRKKKGFGSIANENEVFRTVDAALLLVLLRLDKSSKKGFGKPGSVRAELNDVADHGVECFERAVSLLESHQRLYVLSRLYQSRKMAGEVLLTWKRIIEGSPDAGGEFTDGEQRVREYLTIIRNQQLVQEYGVWLAARNPKLGVQVFADDRSRVNFEPKNVVAILRTGAPNAVKEYLEHLVFGKNMPEYGTELIAYYLDFVLAELSASSSARDILALGYESYRALRPPKPTYRQFITENGISEEWWQARLRLLQLLGGSNERAAEYDVPSILARIEPFREQLVPELIILDGRQGRHEEALRLLTHGLGDYDTAINYCLLGGSSIYHPISGTLQSPSPHGRGQQRWEDQKRLFGVLLVEFLQIDDANNRIEQTGGLLERFGAWFDVVEVLGILPESWDVEIVGAFLVSALRNIVRQRNETMVVRALRGAENLLVAEEFVNKVEEVGPMLERAD